MLDSLVKKAMHAQMITPPTSPLTDFISPGQTRPAAWRVICGLIMFLAVLVGASIGLGFLFLKLDIGPPPSADALFATPEAVLFVLATFLLWRPALWISLRAFHNRPLNSVFGARSEVRWRAFAIGLGVAGLFGVVTLAAGWALVGPPVVAMRSTSSWMMFALIALPLLYIQTSAEEMVFRGYLLQQFGARFGAFWAWAILPSILFGLLHWNPAVYGSATAMVLAITTLIALVFALITATTGNLGAAMGLHFGVNIFALLLIAPNENFAALAIAHWPNDADTLFTLLAFDMVTLSALCVAAAVFYRRSNVR